LGERESERAIDTHVFFTLVVVDLQVSFWVLMIQKTHNRFALQKKRKTGTKKKKKRFSLPYSS
jgi:hypothetical protein